MPLARQDLELEPLKGNGVPALTKDKLASLARPGTLPTAAPGVREAPGELGGGAGAGSLSASSAYGLSPLRLSSSFLNSFGLKDELDCTRVCDACGCVPAGRQGSSPTQTHHQLCALSQGRAGVTRCRCGLKQALPTEGEMDGGGGHCVTCWMPSPHAEDRHLTHQGLTCQGEGSGTPSPELCYANHGGQVEETCPPVRGEAALGLTGGVRAGGR